MGEQGAADGDALLLAARQRVGASLQQMADAQQLDDGREIRRRAAAPARTSGRRAGCCAR